MGKIRLLVFIMASFVMTACSTAEYDLVGSFSDFNEVFHGHVAADLSTGSATITATSEPSGMQCRGSAGVTYVPPGSLFSCAGQKGAGRLFCDDGRIVAVEYDIETCTSGVGMGVDQNGNLLTFIFGMGKDEAEKRFATLQQSAGQKKPDLPGKDHGATEETGGFSTGTGFFVTNNGYAVTNFHVIEGSQKIRVVGEDNVLIPAKVVATDPQNDVALIKIDGPTVALPFKDSGDLAKGQEIATLGYPLIMIQGQESKATFGRVSALSGLQDDQRFIQIDAAIQPGNSGGPLFDDRGNVVGITSATVNAVTAMKLTGALPQNINFALKFDYAIPLLNKIPRSDRSYAGAGSRVRTMADIIQRSEESVVLIVALGE